MDLTVLPTVNATLNALGGICLVAGYVFIRQGRREAHKRAMLAAFSFAVLFFASYLLYHFKVGSVKFQPSSLSVNTVSPTTPLSNLGPPEPMWSVPLP